jgi:hypothetical protein
MRKSPLKSRPPVGAEDVDRITLSIGRDDKQALEKIAQEKRVSVAWVIRDAITQYLSAIKGHPEQNQG